MTNRHARAVGIVAAVAIAVGGLLAWRTRAREEQSGLAASLVAAIAEVEAGRKRTPIIGEQAPTGEYRVAFLAREPGGAAPRVVSDVTGWGENVADNTFDFTIGRMARVGGSDWYSLETLVAPGARIEYLVVHGREYRIDPHNPRQTRIRGGGPASEFVTPGYAPPEDFDTLPAAREGGTSAGRIASRALGGSRRVIVYTPPGYDRRQAYPMAVFEHGVRLAGRLDGQRNNGSVPAEPVIEAVISPRLLDHLIAARSIEPLVVAFVESVPWGGTSNHSSASMRTFLSSEVPAWMAAHYAVTASADGRAILGISAEAREAVDAAIGSSAFGRVGLLIPGRRVAQEPKLEEQIGSVKHHLRVAILAGRYDRANLATAKSLRRAFAQAGVAVDYIEVAEGHNQATWHDHASKVLIALFGSVTASR